MILLEFDCSLIIQLEDKSKYGKPLKKVSPAFGEDNQILGG
jgi:hypothetical protein